MILWLPARRLTLICRILHSAYVGDWEGDLSADQQLSRVRHKLRLQLVRL